MSGRFCNIFVVATVLMTVFLSSDVQANPLIREVRDTSEKSTGSGVCDGPCGWAVYSRFTRKFDYFLKNPYCKCPENLPCQKTSDDISVSAYIYTCRPNNQNQNDPSS